MSAPAPVRSILPPVSVTATVAQARIAPDEHGQVVDAVDGPVLDRVRTPARPRCSTGPGCCHRPSASTACRRGRSSARQTEPIHVADGRAAALIGVAVDPGLVDPVAFVVGVGFHVIDHEEVGRREATRPSPSTGCRTIGIVDFVDSPVVGLVPLERRPDRRSSVWPGWPRIEGCMVFVGVGHGVLVFAEVDIVLGGLLAGAPDERRRPAEHRRRRRSDSWREPAAAVAADRRG